MNVACDPTLERYAVTELLTKDKVGGQAVVRSMADDRELLLVRRPGESFWWAWPDFSPDGQHLVIVYQLLNKSGYFIDIWHLGRKESVFRQQSFESWINFHPDGRRVIFRPTEKELVVWDLKAGRETKRLPLSVVPASICMDPDGRRVAVSAAAPPAKSRSWTWTRAGCLPRGLRMWEMGRFSGAVMAACWQWVTTMAGGWSGTWNVVP